MGGFYREVPVPVYFYRRRRLHDTGTLVCDRIQSHKPMNLCSHTVLRLLQVHRELRKNSSRGSALVMNGGARPERLRFSYQISSRDRYGKNRHSFTPIKLTVEFSRLLNCCLRCPTGIPGVRWPSAICNSRATVERKIAEDRMMGNVKWRSGMSTKQAIFKLQD